MVFKGLFIFDFHEFDFSVPNVHFYLFLMYNAIVLNKLNVKAKSVMSKYQQFTENQQGPAVQHRELCSILCNNLMVTREKDGGRDS